MEDLFGDQNPFSDFFTTFFGGGGGAAAARAAGRGARSRARGGRDVEHEIDLTLDDAYHGTTRRLALQPRRPRRARWTCAFRPASATARACACRAKANPAPAAARPAICTCALRLTPHPTFERKGRISTRRVPVPVTTAVLGGEVDVPTMAGKTVRLKIPPLTQNGQVFRLKGYGMPAVGKRDDAGRPVRAVEVQLPTSLTAEEREHYEALAKLKGTAPTANSAA